MTEFIEQLSVAYSKSPLPFWVLGSILIYALGTNGLWLARRRGLEPHRYGDWLIQAAREKKAVKYMRRRDSAQARRKPNQGQGSRAFFRPG